MSEKNNKSKVKCIVTSVYFQSGLWYNLLNVLRSCKSLFPPVGEQESPQSITWPSHDISLILFTWVHTTFPLWTWNKLVWWQNKEGNKTAAAAACNWQECNQTQSELLHFIGTFSSWELINVLIVHTDCCSCHFSTELRLAAILPPTCWEYAAIIHTSC